MKAGSHCPLYKASRSAAQSVFRQYDRPSKTRLRGKDLQQQTGQKLIGRCHRTKIGWKTLIKEVSTPRTSEGLILETMWSSVRSQAASAPRPRWPSHLPHSLGLGVVNVALVLLINTMIKQRPGNGLEIFRNLTGQRLICRCKVAGLGHFLDARNCSRARSPFPSFSPDCGTELLVSLATP